MTNQQINIEIAKLMGKEYHKPTTLEIKSGSYHQYEPTYTTSLDACHGFEKDLVGDELYNYTVNLYPILDIEDQKDTIYADFKLLTATPLQRCTAFLQMKGKWTNDP